MSVMRSPHRRGVLALALGLSVSMSFGVAVAQAQDVVLRFSTAGPAPDFLAKSMDAFAAEVAEADVGVSVEVYPSSSLVRQGAEVPAIQRGNLEMSTLSAFEVAGQVPELGFLNRAFLFRDYDHLMAVMDGPVGDAVHDKVSEVMGIEILATAYLGTRQVNLREARDVAGPDDMAGVRLRMPAAPEWLLLGDSLGVSPTPLPMSETYIALQTGAIDGQDNPLTITRAARFDEVTQQVLLTGHLVQPVFYAIGKDVWDGMTDEQREVVKAAAANGAAMNDAGRFADEIEVAQVLADNGLRVDEVDLDAFRARADEVYAASDLAAEWDTDLMEQAAR